MVSPLQEENGAWSLRRCIAALFALLFVPAFIIAFQWVGVGGWFVFIPAAICAIIPAILLFFTTWSDVVSIIKALKGEKDNPTQGQVG